MSYKVKTLTVFERQTKRLVKKYASLKKEVLELVQQLKENPKLHDKNFYTVEILANYCQ
jgi:hypothetical protein